MKKIGLKIMVKRNNYDTTRQKRFEIYSQSRSRGIDCLINSIFNINFNLFNIMETAVEWLIQELRGTDDKGDFIFQGVINSELIEQAKEMEKEQTITAYKLGLNTGLELQNEIITFKNEKII